LFATVDANTQRATLHKIMHLSWYTDQINLASVKIETCRYKGRIQQRKRGPLWALHGFACGAYAKKRNNNHKYIWSQIVV